MKKYFLYTTILFAATLVVACQKDDGRGRVNFNLHIADRYGSGNSKIYLEGSQPKFIANEEVQINDEIYLIDDRNGEATVYDVAEADHYYAIFPASWVVGSASATPSITFPDMQTYKEDASNNQIIESPMAAYAAGNASTLQFHNAAALATVVIKNTISASSYNVKYVTIRSDNTFLSGVGIIDSITYGTPKIKLTSGSYNASIDCSGADAIGYGDSLIVTLAIPPVKNIKLYVDVLMTDGSDNKYSFSNKTGSEKTIRRNERGFIRVNLDGANTKSNGYFWGNGDSPTDPYQIRTYDDLNKLRELVNAGGNTDYNANNKYYLQIADINIGEHDVRWGANSESYKSHCGIGYNTDKPFKAHYNGGGHSVTIKSNLETYTALNLSYGIGLFGVCGGGGSISNLNVNGSITIGSRQKTVCGGVVGLISGAFSVNNCTSSVNMSISNNTLVSNGGICGMVNASGSLVYISNCKYTGNLSTGNDITLGAMVAKVHAADSCIISNCANSVKSYTVTKDSVGGLVGHAKVPMRFSKDTNNWNISATKNGKMGGMIGGTTGSVKFHNCINNGVLNSGSTLVGGMAGYVGGSLDLKDCVNNTDITGTQSVGGCIGQCAGTETEVSGTSGNGTINYGIIKGTNSGNALAGGIIGWVSTGTVTITGVVTNNGAVRGTVTNTSSNVGGIVGSSHGVITLNGTITNTASVSGAYNVGGIVGFTNQNSSFTGCVNSGTITATYGNGVYGAAGILGKSKAGTISFDKCGNTNTGSITASNGNTQLYVGGILGLAEEGAGHIYNCYNEGAISVTNVRTVGGIVGRTNAIDTIVNCYNKGTISGSINYETYACISGIMGVACTTAYINNCYNTGDVSGVTGLSGEKYSIAGAHNGTLTLYNCYGPSGSTLAGRSKSHNSPTVSDPIRCATFTVAAGTNQGKLDGDPVGVALLNTEGTGIDPEGTGEDAYGTLKEALDAWVTKNGSSYSTWGTGPFPTF